MAKWDHTRMIDDMTNELRLENNLPESMSKLMIVSCYGYVYAVPAAQEF